MKRKYVIKDTFFDNGYIKRVSRFGNDEYTKDISEAKVYERLTEARKDCKTACVLCNAFRVVDFETQEEV